MFCYLCFEIIFLCFFSLVSVEVHHSSASEDSNSVSDVSDPLPDYDDQGSQSSSTGNNNNTVGRRVKKTSREASSLSTDEGIYHEGDDDEDDDDVEDDLDEMHRLVPHHHEDEEDDEDELHDNEVSFSPHHQEDLVAIRNKRPPPEEEEQLGIGHTASRRASYNVDATHEDSKATAESKNENGTLKFEKPHDESKKRSVVNNNETLTRQGTLQREKKPVEHPTSEPPPPPPLPVKKSEEQKPSVKPPSPPPLPKSSQARMEEEAAVTKAPPPPPPPDLPLKDLKLRKPEDRNNHDDDSASQRSDEAGSIDGEGKRYIKNTASRKNSHQRTLPFIPPQFSFTPDTNENIRPSEYLRQTKSSIGSKSSTLKSSSTLHRAVSMGELAVASKSEKISYGSRTESHETLLENDSRSHYKENEIKSHQPLTNSNSNGNAPSFSITVEQLQTVHLKKTDKPSTPGMIIIITLFLPLLAIYITQNFFLL